MTSRKDVGSSELYLTVENFKRKLECHVCLPPAHQRVTCFDTHTAGATVDFQGLKKCSIIAWNSSEIYFDLNRGSFIVGSKTLETQLSLQRCFGNRNRSQCIISYILHKEK
ncbi:hypothetical protein VFPPC_17409 [Pochonia chlamydosporia 170]|uniref:Uncharacterized protein n=1 Tax=Pochonia chlamydosporia 170 TaxID=1380566 RepID=A0A219AS16_METCM|nr:hypothetical protein VFPPC_17409 [Pochonia chlamydosporia 170]OWT43442.1 hypothetical protein VFPPC_17409 [Pochonia chlamydosporia 170]